MFSLIFCAFCTRWHPPILGTLGRHLWREQPLLQVLHGQNLPAVNFRVSAWKQVEFWQSRPRWSATLSHFHTFTFTLSLSHFHSQLVSRWDSGNPDTQPTQMICHTFTFSHFYFHSFTFTFSLSTCKQVGFWQSRHSTNPDDLPHFHTFTLLLSLSHFHS